MQLNSVAESPCTSEVSGKQAGSTAHMFSTDYNILQEKQHEFAQLRTKRKCFSISLCGSLALTHLALSER